MIKIGKTFLTILIFACSDACQPRTNPELANFEKEPSQFKLAALREGSSFLISAPQSYTKIAYCSAIGEDNYKKDCLTENKYTATNKGVSKKDKTIFHTNIVPQDQQIISVREVKESGSIGDQRVVIINIKGQQTPAYPEVILQMLAENNKRRKNDGNRTPHELDRRLYLAAQDHADYMARTGVFSHDANGGPRARALKYGFRSGMRENIAAGQSSVIAVFNSWEASSGHNESMKSRTNLAGFGFARSAQGTFWVACYGSGTLQP